MSTNESTIPMRVLWQLVHGYEAEHVAFISVDSLRSALESIEAKQAAPPLVIPS
jgi:hypothetical protein